MPPATDPIERAHLKDAAGFSPPIHRLAPSAELAGAIRRFWVPVWALPDGRSTTQRVLQYPVCQLVIASDYAHLVGPRTGLSTKTLSGAGYAFGAMLQPAVGSLLLGASMTTLVDRDLDLVAVPALAAGPLIEAVRAELTDPDDPAARVRAARLVERSLAFLLPLDETSLMVNDLVEYVESTPSVLRVSDLAARFALSERSLQRLVRDRVGLSPKWLIQRRRLHEAAGRLSEPDRPPLAELAAELGYADQPHFARDFRRVTGLTPGEYAAEPRPEPGPV